MSQQGKNRMPSSAGNSYTSRYVRPVLLGLAALACLTTTALVLRAKSADGRAPRLHPVRAERRASVLSAPAAVDPGVRVGAAGAGGAIAGLTGSQRLFFQQGQIFFNAVATVTSSAPRARKGLGPRFNSNSCKSCHSQPVSGGTTPANNPEIAAGEADGATNTIPSFILPSGPAREARFTFMPDGVTPDGGVHDLFTIVGRSDARSGCAIAQPDFATAVATSNVTFRIPTPTFGTGLMEMIADKDILANMNSNLALKQSLGISGNTNNTPNGGLIARFGWKAQNPSMLIFTGEASDVELGISNEVIAEEREDDPNCATNGIPEDATNHIFPPSQTQLISMFMRFLDQPKPATPTTSTLNGQTQFNNVGCVLCHTTSFTTATSNIAALSHVQANLFSDLLLHHMGPGLADSVVQGNATGDEFRTAPLWGVGKRVFFLHDGRASDLVQVIQDHFSNAGVGQGGISYGASEANAVINNFNGLSASNQQDLINFLRSL